MTITEIRVPGELGEIQSKRPDSAGIVCDRFGKARAEERIYLIQ